MSGAPPTRPSLLLRLRDLDDGEAWREFVRLYTPLVFSHCTRHGLQETDAADVAQEVMRVAARSLPAFHYDTQRGKFRGWLLQTTRNRLHKFFEKRRRHPRPASNTEIVALLDQNASMEDEVRWDADYRQLLFNWATELAKKEFQRATWEAFRRTAIESVSVKETADQLGISIGAVYIARSRVTARLRELIETVADEPISILEKR